VQIHLDGDLAASHSVLDPARSDRSLAAISMASPSPTSSECRSGRAIIICVYYGMTAFACIWYFRHELS
jgi:hypothetical protein